MATSRPPPAEFKDLPTELRLMIWELALPVQTIIVKEVQNPATGNNHPNAIAPEPFNVPALLHLNVEAREVAKKRYKLSFEMQMDGKGIWFDFQNDTLVFRDAYPFNAFYGCPWPWGRSALYFTGSPEYLNSLHAIKGKLQNIGLGMPNEALNLTALASFRGMKKLICYRPSQASLDRGYNRVTELLGMCELVAQVRGAGARQLPKVEQLFVEQLSPEEFLERFPTPDERRLQRLGN